MYMTVYRGINQPRSKRMAVHLDKTASIPHIDARVNRWLDRQLLTRQLHLASSTGLPKEAIDWNDIRIRQWSPEEQTTNNTYWMTRMSFTIARTMVNTRSPMTSFLTDFNIELVLNFKFLIFFVVQANHSILYR